LGLFLDIGCRSGSKNEDRPQNQLGVS